MNLKIAIDVQKIISKMNAGNITDVIICQDDKVAVRFTDKNPQIIPIKSLSVSNDNNIITIIKDMISQKISIIENSDKRVDVKLQNGSKIIFKAASKHYPSFCLNY